LQIHDPRLHKPLTLVNLYVRGGSAADSCQWDFLRDLSDTYENLIVVGDCNARHFSWDSTGVNPNGRGLAEALLDLDLHLLNTGEPTSLAERQSDTDSCIDLTLCSSDLQSRLTWKLGSHVDSDHLLCEVHCRVRYANPLFKYKHPYDQCSKGNTVWNAIRNFTKSRCTPRPLLRRSGAPSRWNDEVDLAWTHKNRAQRSYDRARVIVKPDLVVAARIARNRASAVYRRAASNAYNDRWDTLCEKANLSTADYWHFHHSLDKRLPSQRLVLYDDNGIPLVTDQQQGEAFLHHFIQQSNHCDLEERQHLCGQLNDLCRTASAPQPIPVAEVTEAIR